MAKRKKKRSKAPKRVIPLAIVGALFFILLVIVAYFMNRHFERQTYALKYKDEILTHAREYGLDPYLVAAMIHCESGNRSDVVSYKGAVGLMQIMPDTGEWIADKLAVEDFDVSMLYEPSVNVRMGCWYLAYLTNRFSGNMVNAIAAYNAGHGNVDKWLADPDYSRDGELTSIPFLETSNYVVKVQRAWEKYKELYAKELS